METKSTEEPAPRGSMSKFVMASAIVAGGAFAVAAFSSALGDTKRRRLDSWLPNTINASLTAFNIGFSALADANNSISNESVGTAAMPAQANLNEPLPIAAQPVESSTENSAHDAQEDVVMTGYAYGNGPDGKQWFVAKWQDATDTTVRVEYLSTLDGNSSSLAIPSVKKTTIEKKYVRSTAPVDRFEALPWALQD